MVIVYTAMLVIKKGHHFHYPKVGGRALPRPTYSSWGGGGGGGGGLEPPEPPPSTAYAPIKKSTH